MIVPVAWAAEIVGALTLCERDNIALVGNANQRNMPTRRVSGIVAIVKNESDM